MQLSGNILLLSGLLVVNEKQELLLLYRDKHCHFETPGGKVDLRDCRAPPEVTEDDLVTAALREGLEELSGVMFSPPVFFAGVEFTIPDGRKAIANKCLTRIVSGEPRIGEPELFSRLEWISIAAMAEKPLSPDLKLLAPVIIERLLK